MSSACREWEVVVVGAGPAGLAAASVAAESGKRVALFDQSPWLGGQIWRGEESDPSTSAARRALERFRASGAHLVLEATVAASFSPGTLLVETPQTSIEHVFGSLVLATGARERFVPFPGWTLPGVLGPGGLHAMAKCGWPVEGRRILVAGSGPLLLAAADHLKKRGARIVLIAEQTPFSKIVRFGCGLAGHPGKLVQGLGIKLRLLGVPYRCGCWPLRTEKVGDVMKVTLTDGIATWTEPCDYLACAFDLVPNLELPRLLGCEVANGLVRVGLYQESSVGNVFCAGELTGIAGADRAQVEGEIAGLAAAGLANRAQELFARRASWDGFRRGLRQAFALRPELARLAEPDTVVCRCEDVTRGELELHHDWRSARLHTRCGMGSCQGRTCGTAARFLFGWETESVRPPVYPVRVGSLAGGDSNPNRNATSTSSRHQV